MLRIWNDRLNMWRMLGVTDAEVATWQQEEEEEEESTAA